MVSKTGFAPARVLTHELLRLACLLFQHSDEKYFPNKILKDSFVLLYYLYCTTTRFGRVGWICTNIRGLDVILYAFRENWHILNDLHVQL